ncbi:universal stress protein [Mycolicibacterium stellerae]|uniref:universal stress protein n=1 Tax=Mycolicibacterium stellerae TaxID=2358193 RepID=UPI000F0B07DE|nr:universal stress protein [Mycolicibacterium stellerae]
MDASRSSPSIVVGIDGSRSALEAATWAVDEAVSRDVPLRLVYAIDPDATTGTDNQSAARDLASAEIAVRHAFMAVESLDKPVKIEVEILQDNPVRVLREASRWADMVCLGSIGLKHSAHGRIGSTAAAVASSAHCPVAIVHGHAPLPEEQKWVVAEVEGSLTSDGALRCAVAEARLRHAPLRVLTIWQSRYTDIHDNNAVAEGNKLAKARLVRRLAELKRRHPDLDIQAVAVHGNLVNYLAKHAGSIQLVVLAHDRVNGIHELTGPPSCGALRDSNCSVLICAPQNVL